MRRPNKFNHNTRDIVTTGFVITEFDCSFLTKSLYRSIFLRNILEQMRKYTMIVVFYVNFLSVDFRLILNLFNSRGKIRVKLLINIPKWAHIQSDPNITNTGRTNSDKVKTCQERT